MARYDRLTPEEKRERLELCYNLLVECALAGKRCPVSDGPGATMPKGLVPLLVKEGRIRVEIFAHNFRMVTILTGPHAGKHTAHPGRGLKPYMICEQSGTWLPGRKTFATKSTSQPSPPRILTAAELK